MAKSKGNDNKSVAKVPNRQAHSRISFLYQAANYMANLPRKTADLPLENQRQIHSNNVLPPQGQASVKSPEEQAEGNSTDTKATLRQYAISMYFASHISTIGQKSQAKVSKDIKRTMCKGCAVPLLPGKTSTTRVENKSRGGKKPWADVLVVRCKLCGMEKRYPIGSRSSK